MSISESKLLSIIVESQIAESAIRDYDSVRKDSVSKVFYKDIFKKYQVTQAEFDSTMRYLSNHPAYMNSVFTKAIDSLESKKKKLLSQ